MFIVAAVNGSVPPESGQAVYLYGPFLTVEAGNEWINTRLDRGRFDYRVNVVLSAEVPAWVANARPNADSTSPLFIP